MPFPSSWPDAAATGRSPEQVRAVVSQWIDRHPLPYLRACRYAGLGELFAGLRRHGKTIGVLSDYPAVAKLAALRAAAHKKPLALSAVSGKGVIDALKGLAREIAKARAKLAAADAPGERRPWQP